MRLKIVTRYILTEHVGPLVFSLSALTSLMLLNYVAKRLGELVGKGLPPRVIAEFLLLSVPFTVAMTLPMAVLVSTLHAFSRMASENEITAFKASGMSLRRLVVPVIVSASLLTLLMVWFNDQVLPAANHRLSTLSNDIARKKPTFALREQIINEVSPGRLYLRAAHLTRVGSAMKDVTIFDLGDPQRRRTIRADSGLLALTPDGRDLLLTLFSGNVIELTAADPTRLQRNFFTTDLVRVRNIGNSLERDSLGGEKSDREMTVCELERKVRHAEVVRDSALTALKTLDPMAYKAIPHRTVKRGIGDAYCRMQSWWHGVHFLKQAQAAGLPRQAPAAHVPVPQAPAHMPPQAPARVPPPPAQAPVGGTPGATGTPAVPPSAGGTALPPSGAIGVAERSVLGESVRMSVEQAQTIIDGNQVEIEKKFAIAAACVIFVLLGAPIALRFPRGGVGLTIGVSLGVFGLYYVGLIAGEDLARRGMLSPFWAMWSPNIGLLAVGLVLMARLGREGTTSRGSETSEWWGRLVSRLRRGERAA